MGRWVQIRKVKNKLFLPTLFNRLLVVYISILVATLIILFVAFSNAFQSYFVECAQKLMIKQGASLAGEYSKVAAYSTSREEALEKIGYYIEALDKYLDSTTWLIDRHYEVALASNSQKKTMKQVVVLDELEVMEVFEGNIVKIKNGFKEHFSTPVLTIGYPIKMGEEVQYALFIHTPMPVILKSINEIRDIILKWMGITGMVVLVWIYVLSKQMTKPLKEMSGVAKQIANGQFNKRIQVRGRDEIAQLGLSLNNMAEKLSEIDEKRKKFLANVSHDLRSPLTSIQGFITAILDGTIPKKHTEKYLKIVLSESQRMISMVNTILELSRLEEGVTPLQKVPFRMESLVKSILSGFETIIQQKQITVLTQLSEEEPYVIGDVDMVNRVLQNLLDNALKFVNEGGTIRLMTCLKDGKLWTIVSNSGSYITETEKKEIWDRFYKGDSSRGKDKKGLGLGLVIVKEIIHQHQESVGVLIDEEDMVCFYFGLSVANDVSNSKL